MELSACGLDTQCRSSSASIVLALDVSVDRGSTVTRSMAVNLCHAITVVIRSRARDIYVVACSPYPCEKRLPRRT